VPTIDVRSPVRSHVSPDHSAPVQTIREHSDRTGMVAL
jgi:hypothetical protein